MIAQNIYELRDSTVCVRAAGLLVESNPNGLVKKSLWDKWSRTGAKQIQKGGNGRTALLAFDTIPAAYRTQIIERYGDPHQQATAQPLLNSIMHDEAAVEFYRNYRLDDGRQLPEDHQHTYAINASVLNALKNTYDTQRLARAKHAATMRGFWDNAQKVIDSIRPIINHKLPTTAVTLKRKYDDYLADGYIALINGRFCNAHAEKITDEIEQWLIYEMAVTRLSVEMVALRYPGIASQKGWRTDITPEAFRKRAAEPRVMQLIELKRHGRKLFRKLNGHTHKLKKAKYANDIWVSDGTAINWYYNMGGKLAMATTYMVMDGSSRRFLGWSTKEGINKENFEMQLEAYRMALRNSGAKPYQLLFDNQGGHKNSESREFYNKLSTIAFPTRAYRPSGKPVEQAFKDFQSTHLAQMPFWTGFSRESHSDTRYKPAMEQMKKNIHLLPNFEELCQLFDVVVNEWNASNYNGKGSPNHLYATQRNPEEQPISLDDLSELFWNVQGPKKYHNHGIQLRIKGEDLWYEVYDQNGDVDYNFRRNHLHSKLFIKYDPDYEYKDVSLYVQHSTGGLEKVADAQVKKEVSRSIKYQDEGEKAWALRQIAAEDAMMDAMDAEMQDMGYSEAEKFSNWRKLINKQPAVMAHDDDEPDWLSKI